MNPTANRVGSIVIVSAFTAAVAIYAAIALGLGGGWHLSQANMQFAAFMAMLAAACIASGLVALHRYRKLKERKLVVAGSVACVCCFILTYVFVAALSSL
jgi:hypothetical protein